MALALAGAPGAYGALNGFWGQTAGPSLRDYCDSGVQYATLAFVNMAPENDRSGAGYPGINFSAHCAAETFTSKGGKASQLYRNCQSLKRDIPYCQSKGVKVLLSIGGVYKKPEAAEDLSNDYRVTTDANGESFAEFLVDAFGPYHQDYTGPRPFDSPDQHVAVDGFDFDIEQKFDNGPYIAMINKLRALNDKLLITGSPECPTNPTYFKMKNMIQKAAFDALFIQFYSNPSCNANSRGFNLDEWVDVVARSDKSKEAKLFVGLFVGRPASPDDAANGYINPDEVRELICKYRKTKNWGGISLWDLNRAAANVVGGKSFYHHVVEALNHGCAPDEPSLPSPTVPTATAPSGTGALPTHVSSSLKWSNSTTASVPMTTSTVCTTVVRTITACPPNVVHCPNLGHVVTETIPLYTTVCPVKPTGQPTDQSAATPTSEARKTTTVYTTKIYTITACAPNVVDCHRGKVTTETMPLYTTVVPEKPATVIPKKPETVIPEKPGKPVVTKIVVSQVPTSMERVAKPSPVKAESGRGCPAKDKHEEECSGPGCPLGPGKPEPQHGEQRCSGPECPVGPGKPMPKHDEQECSGPGCPLGPGKPELKHDEQQCSGPGCPLGPSVPQTPANGCGGANCTSGALVPTGRFVPAPIRPSATVARPSAGPAEPVTAGASGLMMSVVGLTAAVAAQLLML